MRVVQDVHAFSSDERIGSARVPTKYTLISRLHRHPDLPNLFGECMWHYFEGDVVPFAGSREYRSRRRSFGSLRPSLNAPVDRIRLP